MENFIFFFSQISHQPKEFQEKRMRDIKHNGTSLQIHRRWRNLRKGVAHFLSAEVKELEKEAKLENQKR